MHCTARLSEIDGLESRRRVPDSPKMPLGLLNEVEQSVAILVGLGLSRRERGFQRDKRSDQVASMMDRVCWRAHAPQAIGGFVNAFASRFHGFVVDERALAADRSLQQEARELDEASTQEIMQRRGFAHIARDRVGQTQARCPPRAYWSLRFVSGALLPNPWRLNQNVVGRSGFGNANNEGPCQAFGPTR
jgi:hypothetical protein